MSVTDQLLKLFRVEQQLSSLGTRVKSAQRYFSAQQQQLTDLENRRIQLQSQSRQLQATAANLENEVQSLDARISDLRRRMNETHSAKEYTAVLTELNTHKADKDKIESEAIQALSSVDAVNAQIAALEAELAERVKIRDVARQQLDREQVEIAGRLNQLKQDRDEAASQVEPDILREFESLSEKNDGEGMAEIHEVDRRRLEYCCGACNMGIPIETLNMLLSNATIANCPSCRRILYLSDDVREAFEHKAASHT